MNIVLTVTSFTADVGFGTCGCLVYAVGRTTCRAIRAAGSFTAGRCAASGNINRRQAAKAGRVITAGTHTASKTTHNQQHLSFGNVLSIFE